MYLSELAEKFGLRIDRCISETSFDVLALVHSDIDKRVCTFVDSEDYIEAIPENCTMVITKESVFDMGRFDESRYGIALVQNPRVFYFDLHNKLCGEKGYCREKFKTVIGENCRISPSASISENNVIIGNNVVIKENTVIRDNVVIGDNTIIGIGNIIGEQGFEYKRDEEGILSVIHAGGVRIGNNVELKNYCVIDKAVYPWDDTEIDDGSKIDSFVEMEHGAKIGRNVMVIAHAIILGRAVVGESSRIGPGAIIRNGISIGRNCVVSLGSVVTKNVADYGHVTGYFAVEHNDFISDFKRRHGKDE